MVEIISEPPTCSSNIKYNHLFYAAQIKKNDIKLYANSDFVNINHCGWGG